MVAASPQSFKIAFLARMSLLACLLSILPADVVVAAPPATGEEREAGSPPAVVLPSEQDQPVATAAPHASDRAEAATEAAQQARLQSSEVQANLDTVREVLDIGLSDDEAGRILRDARQRAPDVSAVSARVAHRKREVARARLDRVRLLEQQRLSSDSAEQERLDKELELQQRYLAALNEALDAEQKLAEESDELSRLLDVRLLWIGSAPAIGKAWLHDVGEGVAWASNPEAWRTLVRIFTQRLLQTPVLTALVFAAVCLSLWHRKRMLTWLADASRRVGQISQDQFSLTLRALALSLLLALPFPLALAGLGGLLVSGELDPFTVGIGEGLLAAAAVWLLLDSFSQICRTNGLADAHFHWDQTARQALRTNLRWLNIVEVPSALIVTACDASGSITLQQGLGRLGFLVGSLGLTIFAARTFRPRRGVLSKILRHDAWAWRLRRFWYGFMVLLPAALTIAAAVGYFYTAIEVQGRLFTTGIVVLLSIVVYSMLTRWLRVVRQRVALRDARQRLKQKRDERGAAEQATRSDVAVGPPPAGNASGDALPDLKAEQIDVESISGQTLVLVRTLVAAGVLAAIWAIWSELLPALTVLERVELTSPTLDSEGKTVVEPLTLWSLTVAFVAGVLTYVAAKNLPAVLELAVLQKFPMDGGTRYASGILTRYIVIATGVIAVSSIIGIEWGRAQWIVAALGVGLGFGLQEIVANFVSGLIILFERPVRLGDTVTVGDVTGTVSRLQIRATTITDWDNKEILVPNKSFITDEVINWTLSNPITRLLIPIGIAYSSDVLKAHQIIAQAVKQTPAVLDDPAPSVFFVGFGDSALEYEVRAFVGSLADRLPTMHKLNLSIIEALRDADIEIPFPQRDLHLRSGFDQLRNDSSDASKPE